MLFDQGRDIGVKRKAYAVRLKEAQAQGKETAAQHIAAEVWANNLPYHKLFLSIISLYFEEKNNNWKPLSR